jgi:hypothetical protein
MGAQAEAQEEIKVEVLFQLAEEAKFQVLEERVTETLEDQQLADQMVNIQEMLVVVAQERLEVTQAIQDKLVLADLEVLD